MRVCCSGRVKIESDCRQIRANRFTPPSPTCRMVIAGKHRGGTMIHEYAAIDPMALLFPSRLYVALAEKQPRSLDQNPETR